MYRIGSTVPDCFMYPFADTPIEPTFADYIINACRALPYVGLDYIEVGVGRLMEMSESDLERMKEASVRIDACNGFIPKHLKVVEMKPELEAYVAEAMRRMNMFGVEYVVFGSGSARSMPEDMDSEARLASVLRFLRMCEKYCEKYDITVVIEPLTLKGDNNYINSVAEGFAVAEAASLPHIELLADLGHVQHETDPEACLRDFPRFGPRLRHVHLRDAVTMMWPGYAGSDEAFFERFCAALRSAGYTGRLSFECGFDSFPDDLRRAADHARKVMEG